MPEIARFGPRWAITSIKRLTLHRADGRTYLDRWGVETGGNPDDGEQRRSWFRVYLHRMEAEDPGLDLHDHPFWFGSLVLWGGYIEERCKTRMAPFWAKCAEENGLDFRGELVRRRWLSWRTMRLDECHRITALDRTPTWTLVIGGPRRRGWGFYLPDGYMDERTYDEKVRLARRDMWALGGNAQRLMADQEEADVRTG